MKKSCVVGLLATMLLLVVLSGCAASHTHTWVDATCTEPMTCSECGETEGEALGHTWVDATCTEPMTCSECGETEGEALGHTWIDATCVEPMTCEICGEIKGETLGHTWIDATCTEPMTCDVCGETEGEALGHIWIDANYQAPQTCSVCGDTEGEVLTSAWISHGMPETYMEVGKAYDYVTTCSENTNYKTTGQATITNFYVVDSDATHEAVEGYEWQIVSYQCVFSDHNAQYYGMGVSAFHDGYYEQIDGETFTVNWYGEDYTSCKYYGDVIFQGIDESGESYTFVMQDEYLVPVGYDGLVFGFIDYDIDLEGEYISNYVNENTLYFRLQQANQSSEIEGSRKSSDDAIETIMSDFVASFSTPPTVTGPVEEDGVVAYSIEREGSTFYIFYNPDNNGSSTIGILPVELDSDKGTSTWMVVVGEMIYVVDPAITLEYDGIALFSSLYEGGTITQNGIEYAFSTDTFLFTITF